MKNLLIADFKRILKDKLLIVLGCVALGIATIYPLFIGGLGTFLEVKIGEDASTILNYGSTNVFSMLLAPSGLICLLAPLLSSVIIFKDHTSGIIRNKIMLGYNRTTIFIASFIENYIITSIVVIVCAFWGFGIGSILLPFTVTEVNTSVILLEMLFKIAICLCMLAFLCSIATLFVTGKRNLALAIIIPYLIMFITEMVSTIAPMLYYIVENIDILKAIELMNFFGSWDILFQNSTSSVYYLEYMNKAFLETGMYPDMSAFTVFDTAHVLCYTLLPLAFATLFGYLGIVSLENKDLK